MRFWIAAGVLATLLIMAAPFAYLARRASAPLYPAASSLSLLQLPDAPATFAGTDSCRDCHEVEFDAWQDSHHDHAMEVAGEESVLGDFDDAEFTAHGVTSKFYRRDGKYFVHTEGPGGEMAEYEITHTFGWWPLQQYLIPFPGGRMQCLPIAWDSRENRWFHLAPEDPPAPDDWLYWTNAAQNWNGMCAECHSTNLEKNFDIATNSYQTTWSDIDVGCEACHGPASKHVEWANRPEATRPEVENYLLMVNTSSAPEETIVDVTNRRMVDQCAPCHSRRSSLADFRHAEPDLLDTQITSLLTPGLYHPDGQIDDEVYVFGSFTQSKMYHRDVQCRDCHDVHSLKLVKQGNDLCLQCHQSALYDTPQHHFHKMPGEEGEPIVSESIVNNTGKKVFEVGSGADCIACHMPGKNYMVVDYRPDHGFRIPRPDLSVKLGTPNACNRCHADKSAEWAAEYTTKWYGEKRQPHYGETLAAAREADPAAEAELARIAGDALYPTIVRATALQHLAQYPGEATDRAYRLALQDEESLMRHTAVRNVVAAPAGLAELLSPALSDPVKAVRIEAASRLAGEPAGLLKESRREAYERSLDEYRRAMEYTGDFAASRFNLGNLAASLDSPQEAAEHYEAAIAIDDQFFPAKVNLAMQYNAEGKNKEAEKLLRDVLRAEPDFHEIQYSLGLLLSEMGEYDAAASHLKTASDGMPDNARAHYNYGQMLLFMEKFKEAEAALTKARDAAPENINYYVSLAELHLKQRDLKAARAIAEEIVEKFPKHKIGPDLIKFIDENMPN